MDTEFPCLGIEILGQCKYDPAAPNHIYFDMGSAIAALAFTLAIQQLLRPIYRFRLQALGLQLEHLILIIFLGIAAVVIAGLLPSLPITRNSTITYPIFWEAIGAIIIAGVYAFGAISVLQPAKIRNWNIIDFVQSSGQLLSEASDEDRVRFSEDLYHNVESLFKYARAWGDAEMAAIHAEMERRRELGLKLSFRGRPPMSAFYYFAHRKSLERASYACSLFQIMADSRFCSTLVTSCPWNTARIIRSIVEKKLHIRDANHFIQELARQAIARSDSMIAREIGYDGFAHAPLLSKSLFSEPFILRHYRPLNKLSIESLSTDLDGYIARLNSASKMMLEVAISEREYWSAEYMYDVEQAYEQVSHKLGWEDRNEREESYPDVRWHMGIHDFCRVLSNGLAALPPRERKLLFADDRGEYRNDLVHTVAKIVYESLSSMANSFKGADDRYWHHAIGVMMDLFPRHDSEPEGMNPLQQQLAVMLIDKLDQNMDGWYPAMSRVLIATIGPYNRPSDHHRRTAFVILRDAVYEKLQRLPELHKKSPDKVSDHLPDNVKFHIASSTLTHEYRGGGVQQTQLSDLDIPHVDLMDATNWQLDEPGTASGQ